MDLAKFLSLLTSGSLHFANLNVLSKEDPYEGIYNDHPRFLSPFGQGRQRIGLFGMQKKSGFLSNLDVRRFFVVKSKNNRNRFFINCWHKSPVESIAMWRLYSFNEYGIAIESTIDGLCKALEPCNDHTLRIGEVKYLDYEKELIPIEDDYRPILCKRQSFDYEKEVRVVIDRESNSNEAKGPDSLSVKVNLEELMHCIHISPTAPPWIKPLLETTLSKFGISCRLKQSQFNTLS